MDDDKKAEVWNEFGDKVNMAPKELEEWLETDEAKNSGTGKGHDMGERIVEIKHTNKGDLTDDDYEDMNKVVNYIKRHLAQGGPDDDVEHSTWRYSLMNWGHDPTK